MKKHISWFILIALLLSCLAGCTGDSGGSPAAEAPGEPSGDGGQASAETAQPAAGEEIEIKFVWSELEDDRQEVWWEYIFDPFLELNPGVSIDFQCIPNAGDTIRVQLSAGAGPDMFMLDCFDIPDFAAADRILNLEPYRAQYGWDDIIYGWAIDSSIYNGSLYGLPHSSECTFLYYNQTILDELNLPVPTTRTEFEAACDAAMETGYIAVSYGYSGQALFNQWIYEHYVTCYSGNEAVAKLFKGEITFLDDDIKGAFQLIKQDWDSGYLNEKKSGAISLDEARTFFANGESLFNTEGSWLTLSDTTPGSWQFDWGCTDWPSMRDGIPAAGASGVGAVVSINATTPNPDLCAALLNHFYADEETIALGIAEGLQTLCFDLDDALYPDSMPEDVRKTLEAQDEVLSSPDVGYAPWSFYPPKTNQYLMDNIDKVYYDRSTVEEFLEGAQEVLDLELAEGFVFAG